MIPVYQTIINAEEGNCGEAVIASLLEIRLDEIPTLPKDHRWGDALNNFLAEFDLQFVEMKYDSPVDDWIKGYYTLTGPSPNFDHVDHIVIAKGDKIVHDPNPVGKEVKMEDMTKVGFLVKRCEK